MSMHLIGVVFFSFLYFVATPAFSQVDSLNHTYTDSAENNVITLTTNPVSEEIKFAEYLIVNNQYNDALFVLEKLETDFPEVPNSQLDSINYYKGWTHYFNKRFGKAISAFEKVNKTSSLYYNSVFYSSFCYAYMGDFIASKNTLQNLNIEDNKLLEELHNFQLACVALLQRDLELFVSLSQKFTYNNYYFASEQMQLIEYHKDISKFKNKSGFLAGLISAIVPGMGKFYVGYRGIPFGALLTTFPLAAVAVESLIKAGLTSPQFIVFGTLFGVFYAGNVWGSVLSVNARKKEFYAEINHNILFDMHIPLRRVFEQ
jgi:tetratricopeptide (TPR) repeat protein